MQPGPEFLEKAKKTLELTEKVESLRAAGSLSGERYDKYRKTLDDKLVELKEENLKADERRLSTIAEALAGFDSMGSAIMSEAMRREKKAELEVERSTIEAERSMMGVCSLKDYEKALRQKVAAGPVSPKTTIPVKEFVTRQRPATASSAEFNVPAWAKAVAAILIVLSLISGFSSKSSADIILKPLSTVLSIAILTASIHLATRLFGFQNASLERAFTAMIRTYVAVIVVGMTIGLVAALAVVSSIAGLGSLSADALMGMIGSLLIFIILMVIADFIVFVMSISSVYESTAAKSVGVTIVAAIAFIILAVIVAIPLSLVTPSNDSGTHTYASTVSPSQKGDFDSNMKKCADLKNTKLKDFCYSLVAKNYQRAEVCELVTDEDDKAACIKSAK